MERRTFITSTPMALAGATTLGTATPAQAIGDRRFEDFTAQPVPSRDACLAGVARQVCSLKARV